MTMWRRAPLVVAAVALLGAVALPFACSRGAPPAVAVRIESREQLIGGKRALGDVGDFKISNGIVQAIIQDVGNSRGFGAFGGSLIDVDLVRGKPGSKATGGAGNDYFTEMFPAFFLEAIEPSEVTIAADGKDGGPAIIRVTGRGGDFMSLIKGINDILFPGDLEYQVDYVLEPGKQYLKVVTSVINRAQHDLTFSNSVPFGFITLLGEGQKLFVPGKAGFDLRFRLDELYQGPGDVQALPGEVATMLASEGNGVSYAVAANSRGATYISSARAALGNSFYPGAQPDSFVIPFASGSFLATFWGRPPPVLKAGSTYTFTGYVAIGTGDVASVQKVLYAIDEDGKRPVETGTIGGVVREELTRQTQAGLTVVIQDDKGNYVSSARTLASGEWSAPVPPGQYRAIAVDGTRQHRWTDGYVEVEKGKTTRIDVVIERPAYLSVSVTDELGRALPSKVSVEAVYDDATGREPRLFLYDFKVGDRYRASDLDPDDANNPESRRYLERILFAPNGTVGHAIKPGRYRVHVSRGIEYDIATKEVELKAGEEKQLGFRLRHVMPTPGYVGADFHVHSINSVDSGIELKDRIATYVAEGVDYLAATDHNYVSDYAPTVEAMGLQDWVKTSVGLELTSLEMGHFNAWPLVFDPGPVTHGSFNWFRRAPGELFAQMRSLGKYSGKTVVQINHPRDSIQGYFAAFNVNGYDGKPRLSTSILHLDHTPQPDGSPSPYHPVNFSYDFDAIEVVNSKHLEQVFHYRRPVDPGPGGDPKVPLCADANRRTDCIPNIGEVVEVKKEVPDLTNPNVRYEDIEPAHPGALDDYFTLVSQGRRITATGNSDSHGTGSEAGLPRTYVYVGESANGSMQGLSEEAAAEALLAHRVIVTNGPFIEMTIDDQPIGSEVIAPDGRVRVEISVKAAPWVDVKQVILKRGGKDTVKEMKVVRTFDVAESQEVERGRWTVELDNVPDDSFFVAEAHGTRSMWPVYTPVEIPSVLLTEAVGQVGSAFGIGIDTWGRFKPQRVRQTTPFGFTNPIWVSRTLKQGLRASKRVLPLGPNEPFRPGYIPDVRRIFGQLHADFE